MEDKNFKNLKPNKNYNEGSSCIKFAGGRLFQSSEMSSEDALLPFGGLNNLHLLVSPVSTKSAQLLMKDSKPFNQTGLAPELPLISSQHLLIDSQYLRTGVKSRGVRSKPNTANDYDLQTAP